MAYRILTRADIDRASEPDPRRSTYDERLCGVLERLDRDEAMVLVAVDARPDGPRYILKHRGD